MHFSMVSKTNTGQDDDSSIKSGDRINVRGGPKKGPIGHAPRFDYVTQISCMRQGNEATTRVLYLLRQVEWIIRSR